MCCTWTLGSPLTCGVQSDDLLLSIDGQQTAELSQERHEKSSIFQALDAVFKLLQGYEACDTYILDILYDMYVSYLVYV